MCGITGLIATADRHPDAMPRVIEAMTRTLLHRGPDNTGVWIEGPVALGHTRLSIIDLSAAGNQPMIDSTGRLALVYNGEIYNFVELRQELEGLGHRFASRSDSEVILAAYREWGRAALERFNGMWAFAIWDREREELFAARDRAGKKPLYYVVGSDGTLYFASEIKALRAAGFRFGLNPQAAFDFLTQGTYGHLGGESFFDGVRQVPPGHWLHRDRQGAITIKRYWELPVVSESDRVPYDEDFRSRFRELLTDAVRIRLRSDVAVGATLSGGLDSSTIVGLVDHITDGAPLHLFTSLYPGSTHDETPYFDAVVSRLRHPIVHRVAPVGGEYWRERLVKVVDHQEEPFGDTSIFAHFHLMEAARDAGVPVVLSGQGGDELLLGYTSMVKAYLGHLLARGRVTRLVGEVNRWASAVGMRRLGALGAAGVHSIPLAFRDRVRARYVARLARIVTSKLRARVSYRRFALDPRRSTLDDYLAQVFTRFSIPHLTHYDDRNAMASAVEGRMPFLDHRLVELLFTVEYDALFRDGVTKRVLRETFADLLPPLVRNRRDKVGFHTPLAEWLRADGAWILTFMTEDRLRHLGVLDVARYRQQLDRLLEGANGAALDVWRGLIFHLWADRFDVRPLDVDGSVSVQSPPAAAPARSA
jgi:asparagine synthase (glutamine-hydrolysing)